MNRAADDFAFILARKQELEHERLMLASAKRCRDCEQPYGYAHRKGCQFGGAVIMSECEGE